MRRRPSLMIGCLALLLFVAPAAEARTGAKLSVTKLSSPPSSVVPGESFAVTGKIANEGERAAAPAVALSLRRGPKPGPLGMKIANRRVEEVAPGDNNRFRETVTVRGTTPTGEYGLSACVRKRGNGGPRKCELAADRTTVAGPRGPGDGTGPTEPAPDPGSPTPGPFQPGARSAGDPLFPAIGNGGYDVGHYDIALDYDPVLNNFDAAMTTITARATQDLSEFSLDMQGMTVSSVTVDGEAASFTRENTKLIVDPAGPGIPSGKDFVTAVAYSGPPQEITDPDGSKEGWIRASGPTPDGGFVVNEPIGAQGWYPNNNHPTDKARFDFHITVPVISTALGNGELVSTVDNGDGTHTWNWRSDEPVATYLTTATVGNFLFTEGSITETTTDPDRTLPEYRAIDATYAATLPVINAELDRIEGMTNFLGGVYGPYPFDSTGAVVDSAPAVGYALEVQTKSHFATPLAEPLRSTLLHEISHQWFGNSVTLETWSDIWFNEGWAVWSEWYWGNLQNGDVTPEQHFDDEYADASHDWSIPPATLDGDPALLFEHFPVYVRSAMTLQGYREIVGHPSFVDLARRLQIEYEDGNVSTAEFIAIAKEESGLAGAELARLGDYFQQWLYGDSKPTITPDTF